MSKQSLLEQLDQFNEQQLRRLLVEHLTERKLGLRWEANLIERDAAMNADLVFPRLLPEHSHALPEAGVVPHLIIEGDNFDALRLLRATHRGQVRVIYIDPPYNTGNKDWVYNDHYVGANDRYRHSQWLEFLYQRLCLARDLLTSDGVIMLSINDENRSRLELLMEEVMPGRRVGSFVWKIRQGSNDAKGAFISVDHEHVLIYANSGFAFAGAQRSYATYYNEDNDPNGDWSSDTLSCAKDFIERPNLYYPIQDPATGIWYPCNPERVWVYSSELKKKAAELRSKTMEEFILDKRVLFPKKQQVEEWHSIEDLLEAIDSGNVPGTGATKMLRRDLPDLSFWVGKKIGFGRPRFKRYKKDLAGETKPISSWIQPSSEKDNDEADSLIVGSNQEGARDILSFFGTKVFNYAKPLSLIKNLLQQATRPNDIVLDFFAGSGTTAQAVLELNAEDEGKRRFILCSSTEATTKEPNKNLCRDVCAERVRRVMQGYGNKPALGGSFAYLQLDKYQEADIQFGGRFKANRGAAGLGA
ncbi:site-specific DNA-methyltransferase [Iodobacter sp. CM08]|uniref:site-specific DNA-methyltransferase n=1 Tax=Iodobacter sp. CM08 TaxID=3085902 RepID=UPI0029816679|nr:site-specific DNA-methyltransferase [Iodobacter sp. CM08]MDW5417177.1 site-specific DNA-methyltransferase [Iodobacter sp. CM08]